MKQWNKLRFANLKTKETKPEKCNELHYLQEQNSASKKNILSFLLGFLYNYRI